MSYYKVEIDEWSKKELNEVNKKCGNGMFIYAKETTNHTGIVVCENKEDAENLVAENEKYYKQKDKENTPNERYWGYAKMSELNEHDVKDNDLILKYLYAKNEAPKDVKQNPKAEKEEKKLSFVFSPEQLAIILASIDTVLEGAINTGLRDKKMIESVAQIAEVKYSLLKQLKGHLNDE